MPRRYILHNDLTGQHFGKLTAIEPVRFAIRWKCVCECGNVTYATGANLRRGAHRSCGCLLGEMNAAQNTTHGQSYSPIYNLWCNVLNRCDNPRLHNYARYGGRGITVCARWRVFENFFEDIGRHRPSRRYSLDRKDNDGGYWCGRCAECRDSNRPANCRWATASEQAQNTSTTITLTFKDQTKTLYEWANVTGLPITTLANRHRYGWPTEEILTTPRLKPGERRPSRHQ